MLKVRETIQIWMKKPIAFLYETNPRSCSHDFALIDIIISDWSLSYVQFTERIRYHPCNPFSLQLLYKLTIVYIFLLNFKAYFKRYIFKSCKQFINSCYNFGMV